MSETGALLRSAHQARREDRNDDARRDFERALEVARDEGTVRELIAALKGMAQAHRDVGENALAHPYYEEAVQHCRAHGDELLLAHTVRHLGDLCLELDRLDAADPCLVEAVELYRGHPETGPLELANALRPLAILRGRQDAVDTAVAAWEEARSLYEAAGIQAGVDEADSSLAAIRWDDR